MPACASPTQDLFFHYVFNNFLHAQVESCVSAMLSAGPPSDSGLETPAPNPVVKHVSWAPRSPSLPSGGLCPGSACWAPVRAGGGARPCLRSVFEKWGVMVQVGAGCGALRAAGVLGDRGMAPLDLAQGLREELSSSTSMGVGLEGRRGGGAESGPAPTPTLLSQLLQQCRLVERILTSWEENDLVQ